VNDAEVRERVARLEGLLEKVREDAAAVEAVAALSELYGEALARLIRGVDPEQDELVSHLLLLHGLCPAPLEERVAAALDGVRPYLRSHGGGVELLGIAEGIVRVRLEGSCKSCTASAATLQTIVENAVRDAAPEIERVDAESGAPEERPRLVQVARLERNGT